MTFEEWWKEKNNNLEMFIRGIFPNKYMDNARLVAKRFSEMAWEAAQPKWTLCKDAMPDKTVNCLCLNKDGYVSIDSYRENIHFMQDIIAWMPLPEEPHD